MQLSIKKLQAAMLAVLGPTSPELSEVTSFHGITAENCRDVLAELVTEVTEFLKTLSDTAPATVPQQENKGLYGLQRVIYVDGQVILTDVEEHQVGECFTTELTDDTPVPPTALCTLLFNTDTLLEKTVHMLTHSPDEASQHHHEHMVKHIARLVSYLNLLCVYNTHCASRNYDHHTAVTEAIEETRSELLTEMETAEEEQLMLYEGVECLLAGRKPESRGEFYTEGVLTANSVLNVFGGEAWYDGVMTAVNKVIEKLKQGWEWFIGLFKGDKAPEKTIEAAEEAAEKELDALTKEADEVQADDEKISKLTLALENFKTKNADLKKRCETLVGKLKALKGTKGAELVNKLKSIFAEVKTFYTEYAKQSSLLQKGKAKLDQVVSLLNKLRGIKEGDKEAIAAEREAVQNELNEAKELEAEARSTVKDFERVGSPFIQMMHKPTSFAIRVHG